MAVQLATRVEDSQAERFKELAHKLGTTPSDVLRMFVVAFNAHNGFPYEVRVEEPVVEAFATEQEATDFADALALRLLDETR